MMRIGLTIFALICFLKVVIAQQVQILPPQVDNYSCTSISDLYSVTINNFESSTIEASMTLEIRYTGNSLQQGIVAIGSLGAAPVFLLPIGNTNINSGNIDQFFPERDLVFLDPTLSTLNEQSACLPPGEYEVCIGLYRANTAGNPSPDNLISQTCYTRVKTSANSIFLVSPFNGEILSQPLPILTWTPVANFGVKNNYLLEIVEVFDYQTPYEAFRSNPLFYSQEGLTVNSLQYPMIARPFESCKRYAWRVGYYENDIFNNPGFTEPIIPDVLSDVWLFDTACNEIIGNDPSSFLPPNLLSPQNPVNCSQNGATLFMWSEANVPGNIVRYQLRIVQQDRIGDYNDILFSNEPLFVSEMTNEPFYYLQNSSNYLGELPCIWGVIPFDENNQPLFENKSLTAAPIYCGQFFSSGDDDCPLEVDQASLISKSYNATNDQWIIELSNPVTNEAALLSETSSIEINGVSIDVTPNISDWTTTITNSISWSSEIISQPSETLTLALNREVNGTYGMRTNASNSDLVEVGDVFNLTIEKTIDQKDLALSILDSKGTILTQVCCGGVLDDIEDDMPTQLKMTKDDWTIDIRSLRLDKSQEYEIRLEYRGSINAFRIQPTGQKNTNSLRARASQNNRIKLFNNSGKPIRSVSNIEAYNAEDGTRDNPDDRIRQKLKDKNVKFNRSGKQSYYDYYEPHLLLDNEDASLYEVVKVCLSKTFSSPTENCTGETCISVPLVSNVKNSQENDCEFEINDFELISSQYIQQANLWDLEVGIPNIESLEDCNISSAEFLSSNEDLSFEIIEANSSFAQIQISNWFDDLDSEVELCYQVEVICSDEECSETRCKTINLITPCEFIGDPIINIGELTLIEHNEYIELECTAYFQTENEIFAKYPETNLNALIINRIYDDKSNNQIDDYTLSQEGIEYSIRIPTNNIDINDFDVVIDINYGASNDNYNFSCNNVTPSELTRFTKDDVEDTPDCNLQITNFSLIQQTPIIREDTPILDENGEELFRDFHEYEFLVDTNLDIEITSGNSDATIFKGIYFNLKKSSHGLSIRQFDGSQEYAFAPLWKSDENQDLTSIYYEIEACLIVEYFGENGFECRDTVCIELKYGEENLCDLDDVEFSLNSSAPIIESGSITDPNSTIESGDQYMYSYGLNSNIRYGHNLVQDLTFRTISSSQSISVFQPQNVNDRLVIASEGDSDILFFNVEVCNLLKQYKSDTLICEEQKCFNITHGNHSENDCIYDITSFNPSAANNGITFSPNERKWNIQMQYQNNITELRNVNYPATYFENSQRGEYFTLETNAESLTFIETSSGSNDLSFDVIPFDESLDNMTSDNIRDSIKWQVVVCLSVDVYTYHDRNNMPSFDYATDLPILCTRTVCDTISNYNESELADGLCALTGRIKKKRRRNPEDPSRDMYDFDVKLSKEKSDSHPYTYLWEMSDGTTYTTDDVDDHMFPIDGEDQTVKVTVTGKDKYGNDCEIVINKDINARADCEYEECPLENSIPYTNNFQQGDLIDLCGGLQMELVDVTSNSPTNLSGTGHVRIPWLLTEVEVEYDNIKVNTDNRFYAGEINAKRISPQNLTEFPVQWATNIGIDVLENQISEINDWVNDNAIVEAVNDINEGTVEEDIVIETVNDQYSPVGVPLGINNSNGITLVFDKFQFKPTQNFTQGLCHIIDPFGEPLPVEFHFASKNFFFDVRGPINNTEGHDLTFDLIREVDVYGNAFGTCDDLTDNDPNNDDPDACLGFTFRTSDTGGWGTGLYFDSECGKMLDWCFLADMDIIMPRRWLRPVPDNGDHILTNLQMELCNFKDFIATIDLPISEIPNTNGCQMEMTDLTIDLSERTNVDNMVFPRNFSRDQEYKDNFTGFYLKNATFHLPEGLATFEDPDERITAVLDNWIIDKRTGFTGVIDVQPVIEFPTMQAVDMAASIDQLYFEFLEGELKEAKMNGRITLPVCDYKENASGFTNVLDYDCLFGSFTHETANEGLFFQVSPSQEYDCEFFADGKLKIEPTSNIQIVLGQNSQQSFDFTLNGELNFPDGEIKSPAIPTLNIEEQTYPIQFDASFESLKLSYLNTAAGNNTFDFDKGNWSFASPQKGFNKFPITIKNFDNVTQGATEPNEVYVGGLGFDMILNLNENIGGQTQINLLGSISKVDGRLKPSFKKVNLDQIKLYADLPAVKLDGYLDFYRGDPMMGNGFAAGIAAKFKTLEMDLTASVIFGNTVYNNSNSRYRYWKAEAMFSVSDPNIPGIPFLPGMEFRGAGLGAYKNMFATFPENIAYGTSSGSTFNNASFTPDKGAKGFKIKAIVATTPKQEGFNGDFGIAAEWASDGNGNSAGISRLSIDGDVFSGCSITERISSVDNTFLYGGFLAYYDFTDKEFGLGAGLNINRSPLTGSVSLDVKANASSGLWHFKLGDPTSMATMNTVNVKIGNSGGLDVHSYFMFGNNIPTPPTFTQWAIDEYDLTFPQGNSLGGSNVVNNNSINSNTLMGAGFAFGLGAGVDFSTDRTMVVPWPIKAWAYATVRAGFEINASLMKYDNYYCSGYGQVGMKGWRASASIIAWAQLTIGGEACGRLLREEAGGSWLDRCVCDEGCRRDFTLLDLRFGAWLAAQFPNPTYLAGGIDASVSILGIGCDLSRDFEYGENCSGGSPMTATPSGQIIQQDVAQEQETKLINEILPENNVFGFDPDNPLIARYGFTPDEPFDVPELQSDGSVQVKTFKAAYFATLRRVNSDGTKEVVRLREWVNILNEYEYTSYPQTSLDDVTAEVTDRVPSSLVNTSTNYTVPPDENEEDNSQDIRYEEQSFGVQVVDFDAASNAYNLWLNNNSQGSDEGTYDNWPAPLPNIPNNLQDSTQYEFSIIAVLLEKTDGVNGLAANASVLEAREHFQSSGWDNLGLNAYLATKRSYEQWGGWVQARNNDDEIITESEIVEFSTVGFVPEPIVIDIIEILPPPERTTLNPIIRL